MKIAVEGCAHGELEKIYSCIETLQAREGITVDLLICCGDFQSVRNRTDLCAMAVPEKFQKMCSFHKYYSGEKKAPILTIFIGGNHEASNYLQELPYGGWVAPNIYFLGRAGVIQIGDLRIGGISGIFKGHDYTHGIWECVPYTPRSLRSVYHIRSLDVFRLSQLKDKVHIMLSHDWPCGITDYGDKESLLRRKPFFREDIESNKLGSPPTFKLLKTMQPDYWFSAHLHCQFAAIVQHEGGKETKFLALDKCLPKRRHLQIVDVPSEFDGDKTLKHDVEWLAILKSTNHLLSVKNMDCYMPGPCGGDRYDFKPTDEEKQEIINLMKDLSIKGDSFVRTASIFQHNDRKLVPREPIVNPQTTNLCEVLGIDDPVQVVVARTSRKMKEPLKVNVPEIVTPIETSAIETSEIVTPPMTSTPTHIIKCSKLSLPAPVTPNLEEIDLESEEVLSVDTSSVVTDTLNTTEECSTPTTKKTFKRRNISIYNTPDVHGGEDSASLIDDESPCKLPCKTNIV